MSKLRNNWEHFKSILGLGLQLAKARFKLKNEGSFLGIFWYLLEPFLLFVIILGIKIAIFREGNVELNYPLYLLLGLIMFNFFSKTTGASSTIITGSANYIKSIKINQESLVISRVLEGVYSHVFEIILFFIFMIYYQVSLIWILAYFPVFIFYILFVLGFCFILATVGVFVHDLGNVWKVVTSLLFFITPLFYFVEKGTLIYKINLINPVYYVITIVRDLIIYNRIPEYWFILVFIIVSLLFVTAGIFIFKRFKNKFAELI